MKFFIALSAAILAVNAIPVTLEEYDPARAPHAFTTNVNYTLERVPAGQAGFASMHGGTTGGNGGAVFTVWDAFALRDAVLGTARREIIIRGQISLFPLFTASPGVNVNVGSFKTITGFDRNAMVHGGGFNINRQQQVIIQNLRIHNALSIAPGERPNGNGGIVSIIPGEFSEIDNINIARSTHVWVHHCELADDPWNHASLPANHRRHDGLVDVVRGSNWVSISNTILRNHNYVSLVGNNDNNAAEDRGHLKVTYYHNWFQGTVQRNPRVRFGEVHVVNNLYTDIGSYGIGLGFEARVYAERNSFINTRRAWGWASGQPSSVGHLVNDNNRLQNSAVDSGIPSTVTWRPTQYYSFGGHQPHLVETYVRAYAGPR